MSDSSLFCVSSSAILRQLSRLLCHLVKQSLLIPASFTFSAFSSILDFTRFVFTLFCLQDAFVQCHFTLVPCSIRSSLLERLQFTRQPTKWCLQRPCRLEKGFCNPQGSARTIHLRPSVRYFRLQHLDQCSSCCYLEWGEDSRGRVDRGQSVP